MTSSWFFSPPGSLGRGIGSARGMTEDAVTSVIGEGHKNAIFQADLATFCELPWAEEAGFRVAEVLGDCYRKTDEKMVPFGISPRYAVQEQLDRLDEMGFSLIGAGELMFQTKPVDDFSKGLEDTCRVAISQKQRFAIDVERSLGRAGIHVQGIDIDRKTDQIRFTLSKVYGIKISDDLFHLKSAIEAIGFQKGYEVLFDNEQDPVAIKSGLSIHLSLVGKGSGTMVFYDDSSPQRLSSGAKQWIAGLMRHAPASTAFFSPIAKCYPRDGTPAAKNSFASWGINNPHTTIGIHNRNAEETSVEVSNASSSSNPYLVLAASIAAGLDGITNKMECPPPDVQGPKLPTTLKEALLALQQDGDLRHSLGGALIRRFVESRAELDTNSANECSKIVADQFQFEVLLPEWKLSLK